MSRTNRRLAGNALLTALLVLGVDASAQGAPDSAPQSASGSTPQFAASGSAQYSPTTAVPYTASGAAPYPVSAAPYPPGGSARYPQPTPVPPDRPTEPPREDRRERSPFAVDLGVTTFLPLSLGPELSIELPGRILLGAHIGWMPELYSDALTGALEDAGVYDGDMARLIDGALESATTWRITAGFRPLPDYGLELWLGYSHFSVSGQSEVGEIVPLVEPEVADQLGELGARDVHLDTSLDLVSVAVGWRWLLADHLALRANVGYMQSVGSRSDVVIDEEPEITEVAAPQVDALLDDHYRRYVKIPVVSLGAAYRF